MSAELIPIVIRRVQHQQHAEWQYYYARAIFS